MAAVNITDMNASGGVVSVNHSEKGLSLNQTPTALIIYCAHILLCFHYFRRLRVHISF